MAIKTLTNAGFTINGVDLSDHVEAIDINYDVDMNPVDAMGSTIHAFVPGLINLKITVKAYQDRASGKWEATIFPLVGTSTGVPIVIVDNKTGTTATYTASLMLVGNGYKPMAAEIGKVEMITVDFVPAPGCTFVKS